MEAMPTPCGVPVRITVPTGRVLLPLRKAMIWATEKIMSSVFQFWTVSPFRMVRMPRV